MTGSLTTEGIAAVSTACRKTKILVFTKHFLYMISLLADVEIVLLQGKELFLCNKD